MTETPVLVLIPGLICDGVVWESVVDALEHHMPIFVADLTFRDDITEMALDTLAICDGPLYVAGHSMGARVALEMARIAPARVKRLALLDTGIHPLKEGELEKRHEMIDLAYREGMSALAKRWLPGMVHPDRQDDPELIGKLTAMVERMDADIHARQITALINRPDAASYIGQIACPTLVATGRQDQWSPPSQHEDMQHRMPNATLAIIEDAGHFAPVEQPHAVADLLKRWALD